MSAPCSSTVWGESEVGGWFPGWGETVGAVCRAPGVLGGLRWAYSLGDQEGVWGSKIQRFHTFPFPTGAPRKWET